ncbi:MAG TPA: hypothetical protein VKZ53_27810 [Candidatus Angelobacter sp.]|nr:hypothetical protein [Candidatus Angelobacter sp.]
MQEPSSQTKVSRRYWQPISIATLLAAFFLAYRAWIGFPLTKEIRRRRAYQQHLAARPSLENLGLVKAPPKEKVLFNAPIGRYRPIMLASGETAPHLDPKTGQPSEPPAQVYWTNYELDGAPEDQRRNPATRALVIVLEYPNPEWARYSLEDRVLLAVGTLDDMETPMKFGNRVLAQSETHDGVVQTYYLWTCGNRVVILHVDADDVNEFLKIYLHKYPSYLSP